MNEVFQGVDYQSKTNKSSMRVEPFRKKRIWAHPNPERRTVPVKVKTGLVMKKFTPLMFNSLGEVEIHLGLTFSTIYEFSKDFAAGDFVSIKYGILTETLTFKSAVSKFDAPAKVKEFFYSKFTLVDGTLDIVEKETNRLMVSIKDVDTSIANVNVVMLGSGISSFNVYNTSGQNSTQLASMQPFVGLLAMDVDATLHQVDAQMFTSGAIYSDAVMWSATSTDTIINDNGLTVPCTPFSTGCNTDQLIQVFGQGSNFHFVTLKEGEF